MTYPTWPSLRYVSACQLSVADNQPLSYLSLQMLAQSKWLRMWMSLRPWSLTSDLRVAVTAQRCLWVAWSWLWNTACQGNRPGLSRLIPNINIPVTFIPPFLVPLLEYLEVTPLILPCDLELLPRSSPCGHLYSFKSPPPPVKPSKLQSSPTCPQQQWCPSMYWVAMFQRSYLC